MFGLEIILVWTALMMKKRIAVFSDRVSVLLKVVRTLPLFVWHRRDWSLLRPIVTLRESVRSLEEEDLAKAGVYIAGFTDPIIKSKQNLYDVLVDGESNSPLSLFPFPLFRSENVVIEWNMMIVWNMVIEWNVMRLTKKRESEREVDQCGGTCKG